MKDRKNRRSIKEGALLQYKAFRGSAHGEKSKKSRSGLRHFGKCGGRKQTPYVSLQLVACCI